MFDDQELNGETDPSSAVSDGDGRPRLSVRVGDGLYPLVVEITNAEVLLEEGAIQELRRQLHRLLAAGHARILLNFAGVRYISSEVLGMLAGLHRRIERRQGRLGLCRLDPVIQDMMRICHLDRVITLDADQGEAMNDSLAAGDRP
jgi:anti-anti-sigma factor